MVEQAEKDGLLRPGLHDPRADQRQHRHLAGDGGQAQGLPAGLRDAGEHLRGAPPAARACGAPRSSPRRPPAAPTRRSGSPRSIAAEHPDWVMLYQYGNPANAGAHYERHRPGDPRRPADDHPLRRRPRHHRHPDGRRPLPARAQARASGSSPPSRATASWSTACATSTRASSPSCTTRRADRRRFSVGPRDAVRRTRELLERGGHLRRHLHRRDPARRARRRPRRPSRPASAPTSRSSSRDGGWKYLSTGAYEGTVDEAEDALDGQLWA